MFYLIAIYETYCSRRTKMFVVGEDCDVEDLKRRCVLNARLSEDVTFYTGGNDRLVEPDGFNEVKLTEEDF